MPHPAKPTFIHEMPLKTDRQQVHALVKRFNVVHFPFNVVLQVMLSRLDKMRADPDYAVARALPRSAKGSPEQTARARAFKALRERYAFSEYAAHEVVAQHIQASGYLADLLDSHTAQTLASRAFDACEKYSLGKRGRPRFKRRGQIASVEGKGPTSPINWKDDHVVWGGKRRDRRMLLRPMFDAKDAAGVEAHALAGKVKYVRLIRRTIQGQDRFFVQLVCEGEPLQRFQAKSGIVGIDLGPSTAAIVSHDNAALVSFLPTLQEDLAAKRRTQRAIDRSHRATNPDCFQSNGTWKKGQRQKVFSSRYRALSTQLAEQERKMAKTRDRAHGNLSNTILREFGTQVRTENLSLRAWQKMWGRRMKATGPGMFMNKVARKAENAGGSLDSFNARSFKLSQFDHTTGDCVKKPLSLRRHALRDGSGQVVQRDFYSAWLALFIDHQAHGLDAAQAKSAWEAAYPLLRAASRPVQTAGWCPPGSTRAPVHGRAARTHKQSERPVRSPAQPAKSKTSRCENHRNSFR